MEAGVELFSERLNEWSVYVQHEARSVDDSMGMPWACAHAGLLQVKSLTIYMDSGRRGNSKEPRHANLLHMLPITACSVYTAF
mmetsp:Transcript_14808/g.31034  ORF Transcript_14808/g.31034 Transcript_14808/m.31034 type:complete len:83 (+) Transcript_14808:1053-1301(+)